MSEDNRCSSELWNTSADALAWNHKVTQRLGIIGIPVSQPPTLFPSDLSPVLDSSPHQTGKLRLQRANEGEQKERQPRSAEGSELLGGGASDLIAFIQHRKLISIAHSSLGMRGRPTS